MNKLSIIIPSRDPRYLQKTIDDLITKATGEIEIIIVLDGYWPKPMIKDHPLVRIIHHGTQFDNIGMRESINRGVLLSKGNYIMKIDEHCLVSHGYDVGLIADCEDTDVIIPRRYRLDPDKWEIIEDGRACIDYMSIHFPYQRTNDKTCGLHGGIWKRDDREDILIDETPTMQGSCYFMSRNHWNNTLVELDSDKYGPFQQEAQEISFKTFFSGGRVMVNKKVFYAHLHKGSKYGKGYGFSGEQYKQHGIDSEKGRKYCRDYWLNTQDFKEKYGTDFEWFINKFPEMPGWDGDWKRRIKELEKLETI